MLYRSLPGLCSMIVSQDRHLPLYVLRSNVARNIQSKYSASKFRASLTTTLGIPSSPVALKGCSLAMCQCSCSLNNSNLYLMLGRYVRSSGTSEAIGLLGKNMLQKTTPFSALVHNSTGSPEPLTTFRVGIHCFPPSPIGFEIYRLALHSSLPVIPSRNAVQCTAFALLMASP